MNIYTLWEDREFVVSTPKNPHIPYSEGLHVIVAPKRVAVSAWEDENLTADAFRIAAKACKIMEDLKMAPWFNLQANGNWGLLEGATPFFHIHVYGRNRTSSGWGKPVVLPEAPKTYTNEPMPELERRKLSESLNALLK